MDTVVSNDSKLNTVRKFLISEKFMLILFALASVITVFHLEVIGVVVFILIISFILAVSDDLLATTLPFLLVSLTMIKCYGSYDTYIKIVWVAIIPVAALIYHFIRYRQKLIIGSMFLPMLLVSVAVTLGGAGFLSKAEYFNLVSFYYVFGLGFGMLIIYVLLSTYLNTPRDYNIKDKFTDIMLYTGLFAVFMILEFYIVSIPAVISAKGILYMQWRNNVSTFLLLAMPFAAFKSIKKPSYIFLALLFYMAILLTGSRGGLIFGLFELLMTISILIGIDKRHRWTYIAIGMGIFFAIALFFEDFYGFFDETFDRLVLGISGTEKEVRVLLFERAFQDFYKNPIFGTGLAYMGNRDIHPSATFALCWYHCEPLQIMGSLGLVGMTAFSIQDISRIILFVKKKTVFNITLLVSYIGLEMMSLVNPGILCPVPYLLLVTMFLALAETIDKTETLSSIDEDVKTSQYKEALDEIEEEKELENV